MYSTSANTADWERFIAEDLVSYVDMHYRLLVKRIKSWRRVRLNVYNAMVRFRIRL